MNIKGKSYGNQFWNLWKDKQLHYCTTWSICYLSHVFTKQMPILCGSVDFAFNCLSSVSLFILCLGTQKSSWRILMLLMELANQTRCDSWTFLCSFASVPTTLTCLMVLNQVHTNIFVYKWFSRRKEFLNEKISATHSPDLWTLAAVTDLNYNVHVMLVDRYLPHFLYG